MGDYPHPDNYLRVAVQHLTPWHDKGCIDTIEQARSTLAQEARMELYGQAQHTLAEEVPLLPLSYGRANLLIKPWVKRYPMSALGSIFWKDVVLEPH